MPRSLHIATVAMTPDIDPEASRERLGDLIRRAKRERPDVRLIHFGETILGWFHKKGESAAYHRRIAETVPGPTTDLVARLARKHDLYVSFGLTERSGERIYNTQVLVDCRGEVIAKHRKFWMRSQAFDQGARQLVLADVDGARVALLICADARSFWLLRAIRRARVDVVLVSLADYGTDARLNRMIGSFYDAWNVVANRCSEEPPITWPGLITITDRWARLRGSGVGVEQILYARIPIERSGSLGRAVRRLLVFLQLFGFVAGFAARSIGRAAATGMRKAPSSR
jgi:predicted amidohydrolase